MLTILIQPEALKIDIHKLSDKSYDAVTDLIEENDLSFKTHVDGDLIVKGPIKNLYNLLYSISRFYDITLV